MKEVRTARIQTQASLVQREVAQLCCDGGIVRSNAAQSSHRCAWLTWFIFPGRGKCSKETDLRRCGGRYAPPRTWQGCPTGAGQLLPGTGFAAAARCAAARSPGRRFRWRCAPRGSPCAPHLFKAPLCKGGCQQSWLGDCSAAAAASLPGAPSPGRQGLGRSFKTKVAARFRAATL